MTETLTDVVHLLSESQDLLYHRGKEYICQWSLSGRIFWVHFLVQIIAVQKHFTKRQQYLGFQHLNELSKLQKSKTKTGHKLSDTISVKVMLPGSNHLWITAFQRVLIKMMTQEKLLKTIESLTAVILTIDEGILAYSRQYPVKENRYTKATFYSLHKCLKFTP